MIGATLIIGLFAGGIVALAWLGTRVRNPADLEVPLADRLAIMSKEFQALSRVMGEQLVPAMRLASEAVAELGRALAALPTELLDAE